MSGNPTSETRWQRIEEYAHARPGYEPWSIPRMVAHLCVAVLELRKDIQSIKARTGIIK